MYKYSKAYSGSDEIIFQEDDVFTTKIPLRKLNDPINDPVNDPVKVRLNLIIEIIKKDKYITREALASKCKISIETIKRDIRMLKQQNKIRRIGPAKGGHWQVVDK